MGPLTFVGDPGEMGKGIRAESDGQSYARRDHLDFLCRHLIGWIIGALLHKSA